MTGRSTHASQAPRAALRARSRTALVGAVAVLALAAAAVATPTGASATPLTSSVVTSSPPPGFTSGLPLCCGPAVPRAETAEEPYYTFLSHPDFLNADIGHLAELDTWFGGGWDGTYNSWSPRYRTALEVVLNQMAAERPDDILVAGDLVEGHWGVDKDLTTMFGPVDTLKHKKNAVARAGRFYYREWLELFSEHGLPQPHIAVGDHEVGDNPWRLNSFKHKAVRRFKDTLATSMLDGRYPGWRRPRGTSFERTSYWTPLNENVMLVSVDVMRRFPRTVDPDQGALNATLDGAHLRWFRRTLARGKRDFEWVVVQAHTPIVKPVRVAGSQGMTVVGKMRSAMWKAMVEHDVDLYLTGEVHQVTAIDPRGDNPVQISHGGLFTFGGSRYLRAEFYDNRIELSSYGFDFRVDRSSPRLWQTSGKRATPSDLAYAPGAVLRGTAVLYRNGAFRKRSGDLAPAEDIGRKR